MNDTTTARQLPRVPEFPSKRHVLEADCARCPALVDARERISWGTGDPDADVLVVGEAPGYGDPDADRWKGGNWTGKAYTSRHSGRRIRTMLEDVGYPDAYYTNAVKCFPASEERRSSSASSETASDTATTNREPTDEERTTCRSHLLTELEAVSPTVVLATGKHATTTVLEAEGDELEGFLDAVLEPIRCERLGVWLLPILHPSYQDVWIGRLGYDSEGYLEALEDALARCLDG